MKEKLKKFLNSCIQSMPQTTKHWKINRTKICFGATEKSLGGQLFLWNKMI